MKRCGIGMNVLVLFEFENDYGRIWRGQHVW